MFLRPRVHIGILLLILLCFLTVACHTQTAKTANNDTNNTQLLQPYKQGKIAILSPTNHISESLFNCISTLQKSHPMICHETFPDDFIKQENQYLAIGTRIAYDTDVNYLIVIPAIPGTTKLFESLHTLRPDLKLIACFPMEDPIPLSNVSTAVYYIEFPEKSSYTLFEEKSCRLVSDLISYLVTLPTNGEHRFSINGIYKLVMPSK